MIRRHIEALWPDSGLQVLHALEQHADVTIQAARELLHLRQVAPAHQEPAAQGPPHSNSIQAHRSPMGPCDHANLDHDFEQQPRRRSIAW